MMYDRVFPKKHIAVDIFIVMAVLIGMSAGLMKVIMLLIQFSTVGSFDTVVRVVERPSLFDGAVTYQVEEKRPYETFSIIHHTCIAYANDVETCRQQAIDKAAAVQPNAPKADPYSKVEVWRQK